ncbi:hypothetical protein [Rhodococcus sp. ACT016]|uniref:hypothetical protein n=1 Tax=Rhodococcus sp. ACT016 TaxID=3134808 RepID=UPI003D2E218E
MSTSAPTLAPATISTEGWAVHRQMDDRHRQALLAIIDPDVGEVVLSDGDLLWRSESGRDVLFTVVHVPHGDYVRAMERRTSRSWLTTCDRPVRLDDRDDIAREISRLMGALARRRAAWRRCRSMRPASTKIEGRDADCTDPDGSDRRRHGATVVLPVRPPGAHRRAAIVGFLLWPLMAVVLFFMIVSAAMGSATPQRARW